MKRLLLPLTFLLSYYCRAHYASEKMTYLDENGKSCNEKKAILQKQVIRINDTLWEINLYNKDRPRTASMQSNSADGRVLNGRYITYDVNGYVDTMGTCAGGKRSGVWIISRPGYRHSIMVAAQFYADGELVWQKDTAQINHERDSLLALPDSNPGKEDQIFVKVEIESEFPGGAAGWLKYLNHNLRYPDEAVNKRLMGQTVVGFIVDKAGDVDPTSIWLDQSVAYYIDKESLLVIYKSGKWTPAIQNGKPVKSYKKQPVIYKM